MFALAATAVSVDPVYSQDAKYLTEHAPERYTLVVGNTTYANQATLPSAQRDVERTAQLLRDLHFHVTQKDNFPSVRDFEDSVLPTFRGQIHTGDIVVFYFSGHGFAYEQNKFIAPADLPAVAVERAWTSADTGRLAIASSPVNLGFSRYLDSTSTR